MEITELEELISETQQLRLQLERELHRHPEAPAVLWPFHSAYRADAGTEPTDDQKVLIPWRKDLATRNSRLRTLYIWDGREPLLQLFPLAGFGSQINFGYSLSIRDCISLLNNEEGLLRRQLNDISRKDSAHPQSNELPLTPGTNQQTILPRTVPRVFISSTIEDLGDCRNAGVRAATQAGCLAVLSEDFPASGRPPLHVCLNKVSQCDVVVAIVAKRYGWIPREPDNDEQHSITWLECEQASKENKEVLAFLLDQGASWPDDRSDEWSVVAALREGTASPELLANVQLSISKLADFKQWLNTGRIRRTFHTSEDLHRQVFQALIDWKERNFDYERAPSGLIFQPKVVEEDTVTLVARGLALTVTAVRGSFGPRGKLLTATDAAGRVRLLKRGIAIAQAVRTAEKNGQIGVALMLELANDVSGKVGDGTKTAILIAGSLIEQGLQQISQGISSAEFCAELERAGRLVASLIELQSKPLTEAFLPRLTAAAAHGDELSQVVSAAITAAGPDGVIVLGGETGHPGVYLQHQEGFVCDAGYVSPMFLPPMGAQECRLSNALVMVSDLRLAALQPLLGLLEQVARAKRPLLLFAGQVGDEVLQTLALNSARGTLSSVAVRIPGTGVQRQNKMADIAVLTGAQIATEALGHSIASVSMHHLGSASEVIVNEFQTTISAKPASETAFAVHLDRIRSAISAEANPFLREKLQERLSNLTERIFRIRVAGVTEAETNERLYRAESAMHSGRGAVEHGWVLGGGQALLLAGRDLTERSPDDHVGKKAFEVLARSLEEPARALISSCGKDPDVLLTQLQSEQAVFDTSISGIAGPTTCPIDSAFTVRTAVDAAIAFAKSVLRTGTWHATEDRTADAGINLFE